MKAWLSKIAAVLGVKRGIGRLRLGTGPRPNVNIAAAVTGLFCWSVYLMQRVQQ